MQYPIAAAADASLRNTTTGIASLESCQHPELFIPSVARGKLIICTYSFDFEYEAATVTTVADNIKKIGAAGFILTMDPDVGSTPVNGTTMTLQVPGIILINMQASMVWSIIIHIQISFQIYIIKIRIFKATFEDGWLHYFWQKNFISKDYNSLGKLIVNLKDFPVFSNSSSISPVS